MSDTIPSNSDVERSILSALLTTKWAMKELLGEGVTAKTFSHPAHSVIFTTLYEMHEEGEPVNRLSVAEHLRVCGLLDSVGGEASIDALAAKHGVADVKYFAGIIRNLELVREVWGAATEIKRLCEMPSANGAEILTILSEKAEGIRDDFTRKSHNLSDRIRDWVSVTDRDFSVTECDKELEIVTVRDKTNRRKVMSRLVNEGVIVKSGTREGWYRKVDDDCKPLDWIEAPTDEYPMKLPLQLELLVRVMPGNIILLAGESNAGKSAFALRIACMNMEQYPTHYFSSEMGAEEFKDRLGGFVDEGYTLPVWNRHIKFYERSNNYADIVHPDDLNIFDYIEAPADKPQMVGDYLRGIHERLGKGVAVVNLQRAKGAEYGRGGQFTLDKPRLYLNIEPHRIKIVKAKLWRTRTMNPNGFYRDFSLVDGCKFIPEGTWYKEETVEETPKKRTYR